MFKFNPLDYGFQKMVKPLIDYWGPKSYVKITNRNGKAFWYTCCFKVVKSDDSDERWEIHHGLYDPSRSDSFGSPSRIYMGCITSDEFAKSLLIHVLGTTTNEGTLKYGPRRLANLPDNEIVSMFLHQILGNASVRNFRLKNGKQTYNKVHVDGDRRRIRVEKTDLNGNVLSRRYLKPHTEVEINV